ncbi:MAG: hypothetical protein JXB38_11340 [Anaerolineales bacterium]|nr:hypothetical protein [Anaerolineales bacterium]
MDIRERLEAFWAGERPDEIPYTIYQNEWRHTASDPAWQALYEMGLGVTWYARPFKENHNGIEYIEETSTVDGLPFLKRIIKTPVGEIYETFLDEWRQKFYLETAEDYAVMTHVVRNTEVIPAIDTFIAKGNEIGKYGININFIGRTPNQIILVDLVGLENYAFHLFDLKAEMQELYNALLDNFRQRVQIAAECPGPYVSVLENFTADTMGPKRFKELLVPVYDECFPILHNAGKIVGTHYDGQLSACKEHIANAPIDLIESLTPPPEGDMTLKEARAAWPDKLFWSNINVELYYLPPEKLKKIVLERVEEAAPDGKRLAFEVSEQYPANWKESLPTVLEALKETRAS